MEKVAVEGEIGSEMGEGGNHFRGAGVGVEEKGREFVVALKKFEKWSPGLEAVDGEGALELNGEVDLLLEAVDLLVEVVGFFPSIEATFAEVSLWEFSEEVFECLKPGFGAVRDFPRVEAVGGNDAGFSGRLVLGERGDVSPVGFACAIHDHSGDPGSERFLKAEIRVGELVEMVVSINHGDWIGLSGCC